MNRPCLLCMRLFRDAHVADAEHVPSEGSQKHASVTERAATRVGTSDSAARSVAGTTEHPRRHLLTDEKKMVSSSRPATDFARRPRALGASRVASRAVIRHGPVRGSPARETRGNSATPAVGRGSAFGISEGVPCQSASCRLRAENARLDFLPTPLHQARGRAGHLQHGQRTPDLAPRSQRARRDDPRKMRVRA